MQIKRHELGEMVSACEAIDISEETRSRVLETKEEGLERIGDIEVQGRKQHRLIHSIHFWKLNLCRCCIMENWIGRISRISCRILRNHPVFLPPLVHEIACIAYFYLLQSHEGCNMSMDGNYLFMRRGRMRLICNRGHTFQIRGPLRPFPSCS